MVDLAQMGYKQPQLVVGMDGVGTKIEVHFEIRNLKFPFLVGDAS